MKVGLVGFGVIGTGVAQLLQEHGALVEQRTGVKVELTRIVDLDVDRDRGVDTSRIQLGTHYDAILNDPEIDVVVELVGGTTVARKVVEGALLAGKHVVTANKALLSKHGEELFALATKQERDLRFEASVAGGIPIIKVLTESLAADQVRTIYGIVNGTTNFILTRMMEDNWPFADALKKAQELGFAEADPTLDVNGSDAMHKLAVLARLAFSTPVNAEAISREGIDQLDLLDVQYARELGYAVKLLAIAKSYGEGLSLRVHPTLIPEHCSLSSVSNEFNAVMLISEFLGDSLYVGRGAGARPTANSVVADLVDLALGMARGDEYHGHRYLPRQEQPLLPAGAAESRFYLRLSTLERPGILAHITKSLGDHGISISAILQKEKDPECPEGIPIVILTRVAREENLRNAVAEIDAMAFVTRPTTVLHVEDIGG